MLNFKSSTKMSAIIVTSPEELREMLNQVLAEFLPKNQAKASLPDNINLDSAIDLLKEYGYPTSKAKIYQLTALEKLPHRKYGNKLVFSRKELLLWAESQSRRVGNHSEVVLTLAKSARLKR
jgi:hypothetical protein